MKMMSLSEAKMKLSGLVEDVNRTEDVIIITKNGKASAVLTSAEDYESWRETLAILSDPELMGDIRRSLANQKKKGKTKLYANLDDIFD